jgi:hypothetical protein
MWSTAGTARPLMAGAAVLCFQSFSTDIAGTQFRSMPSFLSFKLREQCAVLVLPNFWQTRMIRTGVEQLVH